MKDKNKTKKELIAELEQMRLSANNQNSMTMATEPSDNVDSTWRDLVNSSPLGLLIYEINVNGELVLTGSNKATDQILGLNIRKMYGKTIDEIFPMLVGTEIIEAYKNICINRMSSVQIDKFSYEDDNIKGIYEVHAYSVGENKVGIFFQEISSKLALINNYNRLSEFKNLITETTAKFANIIDEDLHENIVGSLSAIAEFLNCDGGIFYTHQNGEVPDRYFVWKNHRITMDDDFFNNFDIEQWKWWNKRLANHKIIAIQSLSAVSDRLGTKKEKILAAGIESVLSLPVISKGELLGNIVFLSVEKTRFWTNKYIDLLQFLGNVICNAISKYDAVDKLNKSEERFRKYFEHGVIGMAICTPGGELHKTNRRFREMLGYSIEEMDNMSWNSVIHSSDILKFQRKYEKINSGVIDSFNITALLENSKGEIITTDIHAGCLRNSAGEADFIIVHLEDISQKKEAEQKLLQSRLQYKATFDNAPVGIVNFAADGAILDANEYFANLISLDSKDISGADLFNYILSEDVPRCKEVLAGLNDTAEQQAALKIRMTDTNTKILWMNVSFSQQRIPKSEDDYIIGIFEDITAEKESREKIRRSEELLNKVVEATSDAIWDWNLLTNESYFSDRYYTMLGYEPGEFPACYESWRNLVYTEDRAKVEKQISEHLSNRKPEFEIEYRMVTKTGDPKWILSRGKVVGINDAGIPARMVGSHVDIDYLYHAQELLFITEAAFRNAAFAIAFSDLEGNVFYSNNAYVALWGYEDGSRVNQSKLFTARYEDTCNELIKTTLKHGKYIGEQEFCTVNKNKLYIQFTLNLIKDKTGSPNLVMGSFLDVSERKTAEAEKIKSDEKYRIVVENANDAIVIVQDLYPKWMNDKTVDLMGMPKEEIMKHPITDFVHPEDISLIAQYNNLRLAGLDTPQSYIFRGIRGESEIRYIEISAVIIDWEGRAATLTFLRDVTDQKKAERQLESSEQKYKTLFKNANDGILIMSNEVYLDCNDKALDLFGGSRDEILNKTPAELSPEWQPDGELSTLKSIRYIQSAMQDKPQRFTWKHNKLNGEQFDADINLSSVVFDDRKYLLAIIRDITEMKRTEKDLSLSQKRYKHLFENAITYNFIAAGNGEIIDCNNHAAEMFGLSKEQLCKRNLADFCRKEDRALLKKFIEASHDNKDFPSVEIIFELPRGNAVLLFADGQQYMYTVNNRKGVILSAVDNTDRRNALEQLSQSAAMLTTVVEKASVGIQVFERNFDDSWRISITNPEAERIIGISAKELYQHIIRSEDDESLQIFRYKTLSAQSLADLSQTWLIKKIISAEELPDTEYLLINTKDITTELQIKIKSIQNDRGEITAVIVIYSDITELKKAEIQKQLLFEAAIAMERERNEAKILLENASRMASVGVVAGSITHEINQPLNAIKLGSDSILLWNHKHNIQLPDRMVSMIERVSKAADRISDIVKHMRMYLVEDDQHLFEALELSSSVKKSVSLVTQRLISHEVNFDQNYADEKIYITANEMQLGLIINNLLLHSIYKFDKTKQTNKFLRLNTCRTAGKALIELADNAPRLGEASMEKLFDPFHASNFESGGIGLGLAIVKMFLDKFGAEISADENEHGGTTIKIYFETTEAVKR